MPALRPQHLASVPTLIFAVTSVWLASASSVTSIDEQSQQQQLALLPPPPELGAGPNQVANDVIAIKEGADLDLSCPIVVRNEDMVISWTCDNEPANIRSSRIHVTDSGKLRIHSSKVGDSCNYRCEVVDGHGALSVIIKVIIVDQRLMEELSRRANLASGSLFSLRTINETAGPASLPVAALGAPKKRLIGASSQGKRANASPRLEPSPLVATRPQELDSEIGMQIEPDQVSVGKNKTFSLECRIKHAPHLLAPQIIWLKEFMGPPVGSLQEAIDKNLIYLDGVYYHSLNWPRAITYSNKSSTASSALLIRQSSYIHSGRYACFAAYPSSVMTLDHGNLLLASQVGNSMSDQTSFSAWNNRPPLKYKLAQAFVRVNDKEGEERHRELLSSPDLRNTRESLGTPASVFMGVIATNTWQRNLTIGLLILCSSLVFVKFILILRERVRNKAQQHVDMLVGADVTRTDSLAPRPLTEALARSASPWPSGEQLASDPQLLGANLPDMYHNGRFGEVPANSLIGGSDLLRETYRIDQELLNERLNEHVYSEIGSTTVAKTLEPYYKRPNKNNL